MHSIVTPSSPGETRLYPYGSNLRKPMQSVLHEPRKTILYERLYLQVLINLSLRSCNSVTVKCAARTVGRIFAWHYIIFGSSLGYIICTFLLGAFAATDLGPNSQNLCKTRVGLKHVFPAQNYAKLCIFSLT